MGLELLTMTVFWSWHALQPTPEPAVSVVPTKVILQASWIEPAALRDHTTPPAARQTAVEKKKKLTGRTPRIVVPQAIILQPALWKSANSHEIPPILWAGFQGFLAAGLGIVSLLKS